MSNAVAIALEWAGASGAGGRGQARGKTGVEGEGGGRGGGWRFGFGDGEDAWEWSGGWAVGGSEGADEEDQECSDEEQCVPREDGELLREQAEMGVEGVVREARARRVTFYVEGIPQADHEETWFPDPGRPGHGFDGDFSDAAVFGGVSPMDHVAIVVVVSGEDEFDITDLFDDFA